MTPVEEQAAAKARVRSALKHIQNAREELGRAQAALSNFIGGAPECERAGRLYDQVHALWYRVRDGSERYKLDDIAIAALERGGQ